MAKFVLKIGGKEVTLAEIENQVLKSSFEKLQSTLAGQIGEITCSVHHLPPTVSLHAEGSRAVLSGYGGCCLKLNDEVTSALKKAGYPTDTLVSRTMTLYTTVGPE